MTNLDPESRESDLVNFFISRFRTGGMVETNNGCKSLNYSLTKVFPMTIRFQRETYECKLVVKHVFRVLVSQIDSLSSKSS